MTLENQVDDKLEPLDDSEALAEIQKSLDQIENLKHETLPEEEEINKPLQEEEEGEEETSIPENEKNEKKEKKTDKYRKLQNDKYRALAEKAAAEDRIRELEHMLNESVQSSTYHYGTKVYSDLEKAKVDKKKALEEGDVDGAVEADIALAKAVHAVNDLERWATESKSSPSQRISNEIPDQIKQEMAIDWLDNHPYLNPSSRTYDGKFASEVGEFVNHLDNELRRNNQMDIYYSPDYFNTIDDYIDSIKSRKPLTPANTESFSHVGGVRNSYSGVSKTKSPAQVILSADEKRICANAGLSEQEYIKYKLEDLQEQKRKNR